MRSTLLVRAGVALAAATVAALGFALPASAHVTVNPNTAVQGGYSKVTFRVPNEKDSGDTIKIEVNLPADHPIAAVSLKPVTGWTTVTTKTKLAAPIKSDDGEITDAITKIVWTAADGSGIKPGQFQEFDVSLGPLPEVDQLVFKALQTYSDGEVVRWIDEPTGGAEAEHAAPVLKLTKADARPTSIAGTATTDTSSSSGKDSDGSAFGLAVAGLIVALAALAASLMAYRKAAPRAADSGATRVR